MSLLSEFLHVNLNLLHPTPGNRVEEAAHNILSELVPLAEVAVPSLEQRLQSVVDKGLVTLGQKALAAGVPAADVLGVAQAASQAAGSKITNALADYGWNPDPVPAAPVSVVTPAPEPFTPASVAASAAEPVLTYDHAPDPASLTNTVPGVAQMSGYAPDPTLAVPVAN